MLLNSKDLMDIARHQVKALGATVNPQTFELKYSAGQPRDKQGQFASAGGGAAGGGATETTVKVQADGVKPGDTLVNGMGISIFKIDGIEKARQPGYLIYKGEGLAGEYRGRKQYPIGHKTTQVTVIRPAEKKA